LYGFNICAIVTEAKTLQCGRSIGDIASNVVVAVI